MTTQRLWHSDDDVVELRRLLADEHPHLTALLATVRRSADTDLETQLAVTEGGGNQTSFADDEYPISCAVAYMLTGDAVYAERARIAAHYILREWSKADLGIAGNSMRVAIIQQCCADAWDEQEVLVFDALVARCALAINQVRKGNPFQVGNNWWAVTHSGSLVAALASHGRPTPEGGVWDHSELIERCGQRLLAFCHHFGAEGLYHEGLGYQAYTCSNLIPALLAWRGCGGPDAFAQFPGLTRMAASLSAITCLRRNTTDGDPESPGWGRQSVGMMLVRDGPVSPRRMRCWQWRQRMNKAPWRTGTIVLQATPVLSVNLVKPTAAGTSLPCVIHMRRSRLSRMLFCQNMSVIRARA